MRLSRILPALLVLLAFVIALGAQAPTPPPQPDQPRFTVNPAGRPGTFHFITDADLQATRADILRMKLSLQRTREQVQRLTPAQNRDAVLAELDTWQVFLARIDRQLTAPAGPTAAGVEARLNSAKGTFMCGSCHRAGGNYETMVPATVPHGE